LDGVKKASPTVLLVQDEVAERAAGVVSAYRAATAEPAVPLPDDSDDAVATARLALLDRAGVTQALLPVVRSEPPAVDDYRFTTKPRLPVVDQGRRCRHRTSTGTHTYVEDRASGYWYTHDTGDHTQDRMAKPVAFKGYIERHDGLHWDADLGPDGAKIADKHKGPIGLFIPWSELDCE
jgi:hypothetical protein